MWTDPAIADLGELVAYIACDNRAAARRVGEDILATVEVLGSFPLIGPEYHAPHIGEVREVLCWNYRIFYRIFPTNASWKCCISGTPHGPHGKGEWQRGCEMRAITCL